MIFIEYGCYEDTEAFVLQEDILESFKALYEEMNKGYRTLNYELKVSQIIKANVENVKDWLVDRGVEWGWSEGAEEIIEDIIKLCKYYNVDSFWYNNRDVMVDISVNNLLKGE